MGQNRKLPVKAQAYNILVRPAARITALVIFVAVASVVISLVVGWGRLDFRSFFGISLIGCAGLFCWVSSRAAKWSTDKVNRVLWHLVGGMLVIVLCVFATTLLLPSYVPFSGLFLVYIVAGMLYGSACLPLVPLAWERDMEAKKLAQKDDCTAN